MKKLFFFFVYILILSGCKPDPIIETSFSIEATCDSDGGSVSPTRLVVYEGGRARIVIYPNTGYVVKSVEVKNGNGPYVSMSLPENNNLIFENVTSDIKIKVSFEKVEYYTLSATSSIGGTITPSGEITIEKGNSRNYTLISDGDYWIDSLLIDEKNMQVPALASTYTFSYTANDALHHTIRVVYKQKKVYTITTICDEYSTVSGITSIYEGSSATLQASAKELCSLVNVKVDGETITDSSYTFTNVNSNHTFEVSSIREPEWYLCKIKWKNDSTYIDGHIWGPMDEIFDFSPDGTFIQTANGKTYHRTWFLDKSVNPMILIDRPGSLIRPVVIKRLDDKKMIFFEIQAGQNQTTVYKNIGYK